MDIQVRVRRQRGPSDSGRMVTYDVKDISPDASFLEMLDELNEKLILDGDDPLVNVDLGRREADTIGPVHGLEHVVDQAADPLVDGRDRTRDLVQARIGVAKDVELTHL